MTSGVVGIWTKISDYQTSSQNFLKTSNKNVKKFENFAHSFIVNPMWANFEPNQRNFLAEGSGGRAGGFQRKSRMLQNIANLFSMNFIWAIFEQNQTTFLFRKKKPLLNRIVEKNINQILNPTVTRQSHHICKGISFKTKFLNATVTRQSHNFENMPLLKGIFVNATVTWQSHHIYTGIPLKIQILNSTVTR